jgi:hypothetical protein
LRNSSRVKGDNGIHGLVEAMKEWPSDPRQAQPNEVYRRLGELIMEEEILWIKATGTGSCYIFRARSRRVVVIRGCSWVLGLAFGLIGTPELAGLSFSCRCTVE